MGSSWLTKKRIEPGKDYQAIKRSTKVSKLNCGLINARSVSNKAPNIIDTILKNRLHLLVITETWLFSGDIAKMNEITPDGYTLFSNPRDDRRGGGVGIICVNETKCVMEESDRKFKSFEYLQLDILVENKKISVFPIYRPEPNLVAMNVFFEEFSNLLERICIIPNDILILGDFNIHLDILNNPLSLRFVEMLTSFNLIQHITEATHESGHTLDLVISRPNDFVTNIIVGEYFSDHKTILFDLKSGKLQAKKKTVSSRNYRKMDMDSFIRDISLSFSSLNSASNIEELQDLDCSYDTIIRDLIDKHAPLKTRYVSERPKAPWMNAGLLNEKRVKRRLERRWRNTGMEVDKTAFKLHKKIYDKLLKDAHTDYLTNLISENANDSKSLFKCIDALLGNNKQHPLPEHTSELELAEKFNDFFLIKVSEIHKNIVSRSNVDRSLLVEERRYEIPFIEFREMAEQDIWKIVQNSPKKSCLLDPLPTWLLVKCQAAINPVITNIVNASLFLSNVPKSQKAAVIRPLLKKINLSPVFKNYRPVSNLKYISKLIERIVLEQLTEHLSVNNIYEPMQSAYRHGHSTETALLRVQNDILQHMDNQEVTILLLLDLSAAFDTVSYPVLLNRLRDRIGVKGDALKWFESYLEDREQAVCINGAKSENRELKFGIPQGSVLGPVLFSLYTLPLADILRNHGVKFHLYADDTQIYMSFQPTLLQEDKVTEILRNCIRDVKNWMTENLLQLNTDKTEFIIFGTPVQLSKINYNMFNAAGDIVELTSCVKNLGVFFDKSMTLREHITQVSKSCFHQLRNISHIRKYLTNESCRIIVQSFVCSRIDGNNSLYYGLPNIQLQRLQRIQNAAARVITLRKKYEHITPVLKELHWLPVKYRVLFKILFLTYKCLNGHGPSYLANLLEFKHVTKFNLRSYRNKYLLEVPSSRLVYGGDRAFYIASPKEWNKLPEYIQSAETIITFKKRLKTFLFKECYQM